MCDFLMAVLSGIAIFPAVFACGQSPTEGPGLVYQVLPLVFNSLGSIGRLFSFVFFLLLTLAALTSAISLLEALTAWFNEKGLSRTLSCLMFAIVEIGLAAVASFSFGDGLLSDVRLFDLSIFDLLDKLTGAYLPPICALLTIIFFGWIMKKEDIIDELSNHGTVKVGYFKVFYYFLVRFVAPVALVIVLIAGFFNDFM